jgi:hypothetical protein
MVDEGETPDLLNPILLEQGKAWGKLIAGSNSPLPLVTYAVPVIDWLDLSTTASIEKWRVQCETIAAGMNLSKHGGICVGAYMRYLADTTFVAGSIWAAKLAHYVGMARQLAPGKPIFAVMSPFIEGGDDAGKPIPMSAWTAMLAVVRGHGSIPLAWGAMVDAVARPYLEAMR